MPTSGVSLARLGEISPMFPSVQLAGVYAVIAYYLSHRDLVENYLRQQEVDGDRVRAEIESQPGYQTAMREMRDRLPTRWAVTLAVAFSGKNRASDWPFVSRLDPSQPIRWFSSMMSNHENPNVIIDYAKQKIVGEAVQVDSV